MENTTKFKNIEGIIAFLHLNPARQRYPNLLEVESVSAPEIYEVDILDDFGQVIGSIHDRFAMWSFCFKRVHATLQSMGGLKNDKVRAFTLFYLQPWDNKPRLSAEEVGKQFGKSDKTIWKWVSRVREELEDEFRRLNLLPKATE